MNSISEQERLKSIADNQALSKGNKNSNCFLKESGNTFYEKRTPISNKTETILQEYGFGTPLELQEQLEMMWKSFNREEMTAFSQVSAVSTFKYKEKNENIEMQQTVSSFIYEF